MGYKAEAQTVLLVGLEETRGSRVDTVTDLLQRRPS